MAQILVRNLDDELLERLKARAKRQGRSLQSEVKTILEQAAGEPKVDAAAARKMCKRFRRKFRGRGFPDSVKLIRRDRDR